MTEYRLHNLLMAGLCFLLLLAVILPFLLTEKSQPVYGDISGDFMITDNDVYIIQTIYIMHYNQQDDRLNEFLAPMGLTYEEAVSQADFNQDGILDNEDIAVMLLYLSDDNYNQITFEQYCLENFEMR